ncbi:MAG: response regulator [Candidatus Latescibacteria bacterium]|nr:response regulator [Candidatus Latescibacterota bacterium]
MRHRFSLLPVIALLVVVARPGPVAAHNGMVAIAMPVAHIAVDGDLSDWPEDMTHYPIQYHSLGEAPAGPADFQGSFRVGYNTDENALYFAVEVTDDEAGRPDSQYISRQDGCEIYLEAHHRPETVQPAQFWLFGDQEGIFRSGTQSQATPARKWADKGSGTYEWRIVADPGTIQPGRVLGMDLLLVDHDLDDRYAWLNWGRGQGKQLWSTRLGDLLLAPADVQIGHLQGQVHWRDGPAAEWTAVRLDLTGQDGAWLRAKTDRQGTFALDLPEGTYRAKAGRQQSPTEVIVRAGQTASIALTLPPPAGVTQAAGAGQIAAVGGGQLKGPWRSLGIDHGLPPVDINAMTQDSQGVLWIGTRHHGLGRYDGGEFHLFTTADGLPDNGVHAVLADRRGHIWIGTTKGLCRYDGQRFACFTSADGLVGDWVTSLLEDPQGHLWIGTYEGLNRYDGRHFSAFKAEDGLANELVQKLAQDQQGTLWISTLHGLSRYDGQDFANFISTDGVLYNDIEELVVDGQDVLWIGTVQGLARFDGEHFESIPSINGQSLGGVRSLGVDGQGRLWVSQDDKGIARRDSAGWTRFTSQDGLPSDQINTMFTDREGSLWVSAFGGGLARYDERHPHTLTTADGLTHNLVKTVLEDRQGRLWLGTVAGLDRLDGTEWAHFTTADGLAHDYLLDILEDRRGHLWFSTNGGVSRFDGQAWTTYTTANGLAHSRVKHMLEDSRGHIWFATMNGASRYDGETWTTFDGQDGLPHPLVADIAEDQQGHLWFSTNGGVSRFDGQAWTTYTTANGLGNNRANGLHLDQSGAIWVGFWGGGVSRFDGQTWTTYTTANGLSSDSVFFITGDSRGHIWFSTWGGGITRYDGQVFQHLLQKDGLGHNLIQQIVEADNGDMLIAHEGGMTRYKVKDTPPRIRIDEVVADRPYGPQETVRLTSAQELVQIHFTGSSFSSSADRLAYWYRLQGLDQIWRANYTGQVRYPDLPVGSYTFQVKAVDQDFNYSPVAAQIQIEVHPPYQRYGLFAALAGVGLLALWQSRRLLRRDQQLRTANRDLRQTNQELEQATQAKSRFLASMSHEIRTPMNAILGYAQILQRRTDMDSSLRTALDTIHKSGQHLLGLINEVLDIAKIEAGRMDLAAEPIDLAELLEGLAASFQPQCDAKGLQWQMQIADLQGTRVQGDSTKLRQVLTNLVGNAVKFTDQGRVVLQVDRQGEEGYRFAVTDTGPGMDQAEQVNLFEEFRQGAAGQRSGGTGLGLPLAQRYVALMGGQVEVISTPGRGSTFAFALALPTAGAEAIEHASQRIKALAPGQTVRVLIADDVAENRAVLQQLLEELGAQVVVVENGQQALDYLADQRPDILFLDIRMPVLDGIQTIRRIRQQTEWTDLPVVAISASTLDHQRQAVLDHGFNAFVGKPFRFEEICQQLAQLLDAQFEYEEQAPVVAAAPTQDWSDVEMPADLLDRLKEAVEFRQVTHMEQCFQQLEQLGDRPAALAAHLRRLRQSHEMDALLALLQSLTPKGT